MSVNSVGSSTSCCQSSSDLEPLELGVGRVDARRLRARALLVAPVRGDAVLGRLVHVARADLDLQRPPLGPDHRGVQRLVHVELRHRHHVLEAAGERLPERVDDADGAVAVLHRVDDHAHRREVVDLVELAALAGHLRVDRVEVLGAAGDLGVDAERLELLVEVAAGLGHVALALLALLVDEALDLRVLARVQRREREVLELPLDRVDAEAVRERRVDLQGLLGLVDLLLLRHRLERAHVVQAVGELDQDDPDVRGHRDHHLAVVLGLRLVARLERDPGQLGHAVDEAGDLLAERLADLVERGARVLDGVVQQRGAQRLGVEAHAGADLRDADRVGDEVLARLAALVGVVLAGEHERVDDARRGRRSGRPRRRAPRRSRTGRRAARARASVRSAGAACSAAPRRRRPRGRPGGAPGHADARAVRRRGVRAGQAAALCVLLARNRSPSSSRLLVGPEGRRALERGALGRLGHREGRRLTLEDDEAQLGEDPYQPSREGRGPRLGAVSGEHRLAGLPLRTACLAQRAVDGGERGAQGVVPFDVFVGQSLAQARPRPGGSSPRQADVRAPRCAAGGSSATTCANGARQAGVVLERVPGGQREAADAALAAPARGAARGRPRRAPARPVRDEVAEQPGDAAAARISSRAAGPPASSTRPGVASGLRPRPTSSPGRARRRVPAVEVAVSSFSKPTFHAGSPITSIGSGAQRWAQRRISRGSVAPL